MAEREIGQLSLSDSLVSGVGRNATLERLEGLIDWGRVERLLRDLHGSRRGCKSYPSVAMFKALLLGQWHGLSDPALEAALADRLSFRRFCGYALDDTTPDHVTIFRFRAALSERGLGAAVFTEITRQIERHGVVLRRGTLIDATLIEAAVNRPKPPRLEPADEAVQDGETAGVAKDDGAPSAGRPASKLVRSPLDPQAAWTKKGGRRYFGYKAHVGVDQGSGIIRRQCLTPANVNDTVPADDLVCGDEKAVYADAAYDKKARRAALKGRSIKPRLMFRANKHHPLTPRQKAYNEAVGRRRGPVEQVFARMKRGCGWTRARYIGQDRNALHLVLLCIALNLKRLTVLMPA